MSQMRVTANTEMVGLAPARVGEPKSREDVLMPLSMRERCCVASMATALKDMGACHVVYRTDSVFTKVTINLLRTFRDVTGVSWEVAEKFW